MDEIIVKNGELIVPESALALFDEARVLKNTIKELQSRLDEIEKPLKDAMYKSGVKKYEGTALTASKIEGSEYETVDVDRLAADGLYDKYVTVKKKKDSVRITYKKG